MRLFTAQTEPIKTIWIPNVRSCKNSDRIGSAKNADLIFIERQSKQFITSVPDLD
jgi:hypothetical protein